MVILKMWLDYRYFGLMSVPNDQMWPGAKESRLLFFYIHVYNL